MARSMRSLGGVLHSGTDIYAGGGLKQAGVNLKDLDLDEAKKVQAHKHKVLPKRAHTYEMHVTRRKRRRGEEADDDDE